MKLNNLTQREKILIMINVILLSVFLLMVFPGIVYSHLFI